MPILSFFGRSIGTYLRFLVAVAIVPMLAISVVLAWQLTSEEEQEVQNTLSAGAEALGVAIDSHMAGYTQMLRTVAEEPALRRWDLAEFHAVASRAAAVNGALFISMFDSKGRQVMNSAVPWGSPLPQPAVKRPAPGQDDVPWGDMEAIWRSLTTQAPTTSNLFRSLSTGQVIFNVNIAVMHNGSAYALNAGFPVEVIAKLVTEHRQFAATPVAIVDGKGMMVARSVEAFAVAGRRSLVLPNPASLPSSGAGEFLGREGRKLDFAYVRSPTTGWSAVVALDREITSARVRKVLLTGAALVALGASIALLFAAAIAKRLRKAVANLLPVAAGAPPTGTKVRELAEVEAALSRLVAAKRSEAQERERRAIAELKKEEAEAETRRKDAFLAMLAHELRTPLSAVTLSLELLKHQTPTDEQRGAALERMTRQADHMARLLNDLLEVSRIGQGKLSVQLARIDLVQPLLNAIETSRPVFQAKEHHLRTELPPTAVWVNGDAVRLTQIFTNLLVNAAKYTRAGGMIRLSLETDATHAVVRVADNGVGIEPTMLDHIFEPFSQLQYPPSDAQDGLGIGLALVKGLTALHGGTVQAKSEGHGNGSEFVVRLPRAHTDLPKPETAEQVTSEQRA